MNDNKRVRITTEDAIQMMGTHLNEDSEFRIVSVEDLKEWQEILDEITGNRNASITTPRDILNSLEDLSQSIMAVTI